MTTANSRYAVNSTDLYLQPTTGRWLPKTAMGIDGAGHPVYPGVREFEMNWGILAPVDADQLQNFFATVVTTGTATMCLPKYAGITGGFANYAGCTLSEPQFGVYFAGHYTNTVLLVHNIREP